MNLGLIVIKPEETDRYTEMIRLHEEEATEVTRIAWRIAALVALQPALDDNYQRVKAETFSWGEVQGQGT